MKKRIFSQSLLARVHAILTCSPVERRERRGGEKRKGEGMQKNPEEGKRKEATGRHSPKVRKPFL